MIPKEKAEQLVNKHLKINNVIMIIVKEPIALNIAKLAAIVTVDEILDLDLTKIKRSYWSNVRLELEIYKIERNI